MLKIENLYKKFGNKVVLNNLNLETDGKIIGLLGPNGAGKTTLMKCITSIYKYEGEIQLNKNKIKDVNIGYLPQKFNFFGNLTVRESLEYVCLLKRVSETNIVDTSLRKVNLENESDKLVKNLSGGMLRRLGIATTLIGNPPLIVVDEPTVGLDWLERISFRKILKELSTNSSVIISTHIVEDIDNIADVVAIMDKGSVKVIGNVEELKEKIKGRVILLKEDFIEENSYLEITTIKDQISGKDLKKVLLVKDFDKNILETNKEKFIIPNVSLEDVYYYYIKR